MAIYIRTTTGTVIKESAIAYYKWHDLNTDHYTVAHTSAGCTVELAKTPNRSDHDALVSWIIETGHTARKCEDAVMLDVANYLNGHMVFECSVCHTNVPLGVGKCPTCPEAK